MVRGLTSFQRQPLSPLDEHESVDEGPPRAEVEAARCKRLLRELEALGALDHPPGPVEEGGDGDGALLLSSLSDPLLSSLSLSGLHQQQPSQQATSPRSALAASSLSLSLSLSRSCPACGEMLEEEIVAGSGVCEYCGQALEPEPEPPEVRPLHNDNYMGVHF